MFEGFCDKMPETVSVIKAGRAAREEHGELYGGQVIKLTEEQLKALNNGSQLAIAVMDEYVLFISGPAAKEE